VNKKLDNFLGYGMVIVCIIWAVLIVFATAEATYLVKAGKTQLVKSSVCRNQFGHRISPERCNGD
jgi:hypothetical protein